MKLIDVIKTKNGLSYLEKNKDQISQGYNRLDLETKFNPDHDYGESTFSYKEYVRKFPKTINSTVRDVLYRMYNNGANKRLVALLCDFDHGMNPVLDFDGDCIDVELDGDISFTPYNKLPAYTGYFNTEKGRQRMSMFKFYKKIAPKDILEQQIKEFVDLFYAEVALDLSLEFVKGADIGKYYNKINTAGWSKTSCMTQREVKKFKLYTDNPDSIELGIIRNKEEIVGRFLRWKTEELDWVEDVLYYKSYPVFSWYNARAIAENSWRKIHNKHFQNTKTEYKDKVLSVKILYRLHDYDGSTRPYLDTFGQRHSNEGKTLHNM